MGLGADTSVGGEAGGASSGPDPMTASSGDIGGTGSGASPGGGGLMGIISAFLKNPKNMSTIGEVAKAISQMQTATGKLPPQAKEFMVEGMKRSLMGGGGPTPSGGTKLGSMDTSAPYKGDIPSFEIDPQMARMALQSLGIPYN